MYSFFWVIPQHLNFVWRHFGTLCLFHLQRRFKAERWDRVFQNINLRCWEITQKKEHSIQYMANIWFYMVICSQPNSSVTKSDSYNVKL
jgi:hypothetical protein